jgi:hypothetical protein
MIQAMIEARNNYRTSLVVDDYAESRRILGRMLELRYFRVGPCVMNWTRTPTFTDLLTTTRMKIFPSSLWPLHIALTYGGQL